MWMEMGIFRVGCGVVFTAAGAHWQDGYERGTNPLHLLGELPPQTGSLIGDEAPGVVPEGV
jgi:hypothetical protein